MERNARSRLNPQIYEQACMWFVECRGGDLDVVGRREFDRWLRRSPEHLSAYIEIAAIWNEGPLLDPEGKWDADTLIAQAAEATDNVVPMTGVAERPPPPSNAGKRRRPLALAASVAAVSLAVGTLAWMQLFGAQTYATAIGEQRSIALADGSTIELNSLSRIKVRYSEQQRSIELVEGQALFRVAKDGARPFVVDSDGTRVRAVGTQFDVYRKRGDTIVTVVEGRVSISTAAAAAGSGPDVHLTGASAANDAPTLSAASPILLAAGEQITVTDDSVQRTVQPNIESATAWTQRQLVFDSASLSEVAEEFNRYNQRQLVIEDAGSYGFHISGVFASTDPSSLIRFLRQRPGVRVIETATQIRVEKIPARQVTDP